MLGPVFSLEVLLAGRRGRFRAWMRFYTAFLALEFAAFLFAHISTIEPEAQSAAPAISWWVNSYLQFFIVQHFLLLALAIPAFTAGSLSDDKVRGTLQDLLTTDLSAIEIIGAKLLARVGQVLVLAFSGLP